MTINQISASGAYSLFLLNDDTIDNTRTYGYETNHTSALISITSSGSILVSRVKKTYPGF